MGKIEKYWPKEEIIKALQNLPRNITLNNKILFKYNKKGLICHPTLINRKFGSIRNACIIANISYEYQYRKGYWTKDKIINALQNLPKDKPINFYIIEDYHYKGIICTPCLISRKFGTIKNACEQAGVKCNALYKEEKIKNMLNKTTIYNKETLIKILKEGYKKYGCITPSKLVYYINKDNKCDIGPSIRKFFKRVSIAFQEANIPYKNYWWTKERIMNTLLQLYNKKPFSKTELSRFKKEEKICSIGTITNRFGCSLDDVEKIVGFKFVKPAGHNRIGKYEKEILDKIEQEKGIKLIRQYSVARKYIDGYDPINNIAYEVDEIQHKHIIIEDCIREQRIKEVISCTFERIKLY